MAFYGVNDVCLFSLYLTCTLVCGGQAIEYTVTEETNNAITMDIIKDSGLASKYNTAILNTIKLSLVTSDQGYNNYFAINSTGHLTITKTIDREVFCAQLESCILLLDVEVSEPRERWEIFKVNINVLDRNDNAPKFDTRTYEVPLSEVSVPPLSVSLPVATDPDSPQNGIKKYQLFGSPDTFSLKVLTNPDGSVEPSLLLNSQLDREKISTYSLELRAIDGGVPQLTGTVTVSVKVIDVNDQYPQFQNISYEISVYENLPAWQNILTTKATDKDEGINAEISYSLKAKTEEIKNLFEINEKSGDIYVIGDLDYEKETKYMLTVIAQNKGQSSLTSSAKVVINLMDVNDNSPVIKLKSSDGKRVDVPENQPIGTFVAHVSVSDKDSAINGKFNCTTYSDSDSFSLERINENDFKLVSKVVLDREESVEYPVDIVCEDFGSRPLSSHVQATVTVTDVNDNPPVFEHSTYITQVEETDQVGKLVMIVKATDRDLSDNGRVTYALYSLSEQTKGLFQIDPVKGSIKNIKSLDHEKNPRINLEVRASDNGVPPKSSSASLVIDLIDTDDESPLFNKSIYNFAVHENKPINTYVGKVQAFDPDSPPFNGVSYSIQNSINELLPFRINKDTGEILTTGALDRERTASYNFIVVAQGPSPAHRGSSAKVNIFVADENDHAPKFLFPNTVNNTVYVNNKLKAGAVVTAIYGEDKDTSDNALLHYSIRNEDSSDYFTIDEYTGVITTKTEYEAIDKALVLSVTVRDSGEKQYSDSGYLNIVFVKSKGLSSSDVNQDIVIGIAVVASLIVTVLVLTIACLLCRRQRQIQHQKTMTAIKTRLEPSVQQVQHVEPMPAVERWPNTLDISFQSSAEKSSLQGGYLNNGLVYDPDRDSILVQRWADGNSAVQATKQKLDSSRQHNQGHMDDDSDSACSLGDSNTDSGRGSHDDHNVTDPAILYPRPVLTYTAQTSNNKPVSTRQLHPGLHHVNNPNPSTSNQNIVSNEQTSKAPRALDYRRDSYRNILDKALEEREKVNINQAMPPSNIHKPADSYKQNNLRAYQEAKQIQFQKQLQLQGMPKKNVHYCSQV